MRQKTSHKRDCTREVTCETHSSAATPQGASGHGVYGEKGWSNERFGLWEEPPLADPCLRSALRRRESPKTRALRKARSWRFCRQGKKALNRALSRTAAPQQNCQGRGPLLLKKAPVAAPSLCSSLPSRCCRLGLRAKGWGNLRCLSASLRRVRLKRHSGLLHPFLARIPRPPLQERQAAKRSQEMTAEPSASRRRDRDRRSRRLTLDCRATPHLSSFLPLDAVLRCLSHRGTSRAKAGRPAL